MTLGVSSDARVAAEYHHATGATPSCCPRR